MASLMPNAKQPYWNNAGSPLAGGKVYTYAAGTTTPKATYTTAAATTANSNPVILDARGEAPIYWDGSYYIEVKDASDVLVYSADNYTEPASLVTALRTDLAATSGAALIGFQQSGTGAVVRLLLDKARERKSFEDFGAVGDFDPSTGLGTDDRAAIQKAITWAMTQPAGAVLLSTAGKRYYLGAGYSNATIGAQLLIGSQAATNAANNITIETYGAEIYAGAAGFAVAFANANSCKWLGARIIGYTGGTLGSGRENDSLILINRNCRDITIKHHYLTNSLGDCITISGAVDVANGGTGYTQRNIRILDGVLKERYGNGTASNAGGTRSREAISVIDAVDVQISGNTIYGSIDLEPNITGQYIGCVKTHDNDFLLGHVTAQSSIGTAYWYDEPIGLSGGSSLDCAVKLQGVAGAPIIFGNAVYDNHFEAGTITSSYSYVFDRITNNTFDTGLISMAIDNVVGSMVNTLVAGNSARGVIGSNTAFIVLNGQVANSVFANNTLFKSGSYTCIKIGVASVGPAFDQGNTFVNNQAIGGTAGISGTTNASSKILNAFETAPFVPMVTISGFAGTSQTLNYLTYRGDYWYIQQASGTATSLADISNSLGDGQELTIMAEASGGGSLTLINSASLKLKGGVNAVLSNTNCVTLRRNFSRWVEVSRNF
jgi:hypothetical protein